MIISVDEQYGQLAITNIISCVWLGDWDRYEAIFQAVDDELKSNFPFHVHYDRGKVHLWHENHFKIPGAYFIPPYYSSYRMDENAEEKRKNLLCLIGTYEKMGFYFPLQQELYPDHIGCLFSFVGALQQEKIQACKKSDLNLYKQLHVLEMNMLQTYVVPVVQEMKILAENKVKHPFFSEFLAFCHEILQEENLR